MQHVQVPLFDITRQEQVQGLRLADVGGAIGGEVDDPALIDLERRLEHVLFVIRQDVEMTDRTLIFKDRTPDRVRVHTLLVQHLLKIGVLDREGP